MSRGKLTIAAVPVAGSTLTTSSVSVRAWVRISLESIPRNRMLIRDWAVAGVEIGVATGSTAPFAEPTGVGVTVVVASPVLKIFEPA